MSDVIKVLIGTVAGATIAVAVMCCIVAGRDDS